MQLFYRPGGTTIEVIAPSQKPEGPKGEVDATLWGLTLVSNDINKTHVFLKQSTKPPWDAVQPGRKMTVLNGKVHGVSVLVAIMSPHVKAKISEEELIARARAQEKELAERRKSNL